MRITTLGVLVLLVVTCACAWATGCAGSKTASGPLHKSSLEFKLTRWNGRWLEGRVLIRGNYVRDFVIHRQLSEFEDVSLEKARACDTTKVLSYTAWLRMRYGPRDDVIDLFGIDWIGTDVAFPLSEIAWPWPDCIEADLVVRAADGREAGRLPIRVERTDKSKDTPDGGSDAEPLCPDGGAP